MEDALIDAWRGGHWPIGVTLLLSSGMRWRRRATVLVLVLSLGLATGYVAGHNYVRGAAFVVRAAGMQGIARTVSAWETRAFDEQTKLVRVRPR